MTEKVFVVREGFNYRVRDEKGNEKVYSEGDTVALDEIVGDALHQLQRIEGPVPVKPVKD